MKLNKKGLTLVELIISVVLIVIIMFFMYRLLSDINAAKHDNSYAQDNALVRSEIIKLISNDLFSYNINKIDVSNSSDRLNLTLTLLPNSTDDVTASTKTAVIGIEENTFYYTQADGTNRKWEMNNATLNSDKVNIQYNEDANTYSLLLSILVYTDNDFNRQCPNCQNNVVDDIIISHMGEGKITNLNGKSCLGNNC